MMAEQLLEDTITKEERVRIAGKWLRRARTDMALSQEKFAKLIRKAGDNGPVGNTVARWERAEMRPSLQRLDRLANVLGLPRELVVDIMHRLNIERIPEDL